MFPCSLCPLCSIVHVYYVSVSACNLLPLSLSGGLTTCPHLTLLILVILSISLSVSAQLDFRVCSSVFPHQQPLSSLLPFPVVSPAVFSSVSRTPPRSSAVIWNTNSKSGWFSRHGGGEEREGQRWRRVAANQQAWEGRMIGGQEWRGAAASLRKFHLDFAGRKGLGRDREGQRGKRDTERGD